MSKTFKTRPIDVQMFGKNRTIIPEAVHDHTNGRECDLPEPNYKSHISAEERNGHLYSCYWNYQYNGKNFFCGCAMCTGQAERKEDRRRDRHETKVNLREVVKSNGDDDALEMVI